MRTFARSGWDRAAPTCDKYLRAVMATQRGTTRMVALIVAQDEAAMPTIVANIDAAAVTYRDKAGSAEPIAACVLRSIRT